MVSKSRMQQSCSWQNRRSVRNSSKMAHLVFRIPKYVFENNFWCENSIYFSMQINVVDFVINAIK